MAKPLVSILVGTHNRRELLKHSLRSIFAQEVDVEVIVVRTAGDTEALMIREIQDDRVKVLQSPWANYFGPLLNMGIKEAKAQWFFDLADDDMLPPGALIALLEVAEGHQADIVSGVHFNIEANTSWDDISDRPAPRASRVHDYTWKRLIHPFPRQPMPGYSLFRTSTIRDISVDEARRVYVDSLFGISAFARSRHAIYTNMPIYAYRKHQGQITNTLDPIEGYKFITETIAWAAAEFPEIRSFTREHKSAALRSLAGIYYANHLPWEVGKCALSMALNTPIVTMHQTWWKMVGHSLARGFQNSLSPRAH